LPSKIEKKLKIKLMEVKESGIREEKEITKGKAINEEKGE
jgi:hypothetical protein